MNYTLNEHQRITGIISGTYTHAIPQAQRAAWHSLKIKNEAGQTLSPEEISFLQHINAHTSKRYAARQRARNYNFVKVADKFYNPAKRI